MGETAIRATVNTNVAEQVAAARAILWRAASYWLLFGLCVILPVVAVASELVIRVPQERWPTWAMVVVAILCAAFWWFYPWYLVRMSRRGNPHASGPFEYTLDESVVRVARQDAVTEFKWAAFQRARETDRFFLLYVRRHLAYFIPKRVISPSDTTRLRTLIASQLGGRARLPLAAQQ